LRCSDQWHTYTRSALHDGAFFFCVSVRREKVTAVR
jgi:hypothetical protein